MEHQVFVPVPADRLATALADPARVARAVPGLQQDAGAPPVAGRLKLRVGGHSVTYRGTARVLAREDGTYTVEGDATEARGGGAVKLALTLRLADAEGGTTVTAEGGADASGRITELPADTVAAAAARLLTRFLEALGERAKEPGRRRRRRRRPGARPSSTPRFRHPRSNPRRTTSAPRRARGSRPRAWRAPRTTSPTPAYRPPRRPTPAAR